MGYREPDTTTARFICTVCFRTVSSGGGKCPRCGVEQLPLVNDQVLDELRKYAEAKTQRKQRRHFTAMVLLTFAVALAIYIPLGLALGITLFQVPRFFQTRAMPVNPIFVLIWLAVAIPIGVWDQRRRPQRDDVMTLGAPELLRLLGLSVEH
jgi:hypothetical protein